MIREVKQVPPPDFKAHVEPHKHRVSSLYGVIGELTIEVTLDGEKHEVSGPGSVFIPSGVVHTVRYLKGHGYLIAILMSGKYE